MNVILIMSDTFRFDNLGGTTGKHPRFHTAKREVETPWLDKFAACSSVFERAYAGSFPTIPCRKDIFTGRMFPFNAWGPLKERTFVTELIEAGYVTQMITDTPHPVKEDYNFARDFDGWEWIRGQEGDRLSCDVPEWPIDPKKCRVHGTRHANWVQHLGNLDVLGRRYEEECFCAQTMKAAAHWLERRYHRTTPFFLYIDTFDPHEPWDAPQWYEDYYDPNYTGEVNRYPRAGSSSIFSKAELNHIRAVYAAEVMLVDRWIGHLLVTVERMGLMDNTCIIFLADHGYLLGEHGRTGKNGAPMYEEIAHIPMLIHMPGQTRSQRVKSLVQPVDLPATILDLAQVNTDLQLQGLSLRPALEGQSQITRRHAFTGGGKKGIGITSKDWSLVYPTSDDSKAVAQAPLLYHLASDPTQKKNVLKGNEKQARAMRDACLRTWEAAGSPLDSDFCPEI